MADKKQSIIIIKKKKGGHGGHHGGAWKIAYADLVTAMMAFFLVMWIIGMDVETKQGIAEYFNNMSARSTHEPSSTHVVNMKGAPLVRPRLMPPAPRDNNLDQQNAKLIAGQIDSMISANSQLERLRSSIAVKVEDTQMRIDFHDGGGQSLFVGDSVQLRPESRALLEGVAALFLRHRSKVRIEGHSESRGNAGGAGQGMWELSTGRAVSVRGALANTGITDERVLEIRGLGDTQPSLPDDPSNPANRRVTIVIPYDLDQ